MVATKTQFAKIRAELKSLEEATLHGMMEEDREYTRIIGEKLEWAMEAPLVGTEVKDLDGTVLLSGRLMASW